MLTLLLILIFAALLWLGSHLYPSFYSHLAKRLITFLCGFKHKTIRANGITWPYVEKNINSKQTIVFIHGLNAWKETWLPYATHLNRTLGKGQYRIIALDLAGFGEHPRDPVVPTDIDAQAQYIINFLDALNISHAHLAGNSMGGLIAAKVALQNPDRVSSLTLMNNAGVITDVITEIQRLLESGINPFLLNSVESFDRISALSVYKQTSIPKFIKLAVAKDHQDNQAFYEALTQRLIEDVLTKPLNPDLHKLTMPTLVIWGKHDKIIDISSCSHLEREIPHCKTAILHNSAHIPFAEETGKTAFIHQEFLTNL